MRGWNCRMVELNREPVSGWAWKSVRAHNPQRAAVAYCNDVSVWQDAQWENGSDAVVEVEEHGGENGTHRMAVVAYEVLEFSATPADQTV